MNTADPPLLEIVVPAYNEAARLPNGLAQLSTALRELPFPTAIIVVDNASEDTTSEIVRGWSGPVPVRLVDCAVRGKGAAVRTGLLATNAPYTGFCDADMATGLGALGAVVDLLRAGHPVVVGSRRHPLSRVEDYSHPLRKLGAVLFNWLIRDLAGGVTDTQCGFKFFAGPLARAAAADLRTTGFAFDVELLIHCARRGAAITDLPVEWRDVPGSKFSVRRHSFSCLWDLVRIRFHAARVADVHPERPAPQQAPVAVEPAFPVTESKTGPG